MIDESDKKWYDTFTQDVDIKRQSLEYVPSKAVTNLILWRRKLCLVKRRKCVDTSLHFYCDQFTRPCMWTACIQATSHRHFLSRGEKMEGILTSDAHNMCEAEILQRDRRG